jgi:hypothetical protein
MTTDPTNLCERPEDAARRFALENIALRERAERAERERDAAVANAYEVGKRDGASAQRERDAGIAESFARVDSRCKATRIAATIRQQDKGEPG